MGLVDLFVDRGDCCICGADKVCQEIRGGFLCRTCLKKCDGYIENPDRIWKTRSPEDVAKAVRDYDENLKKQEQFVVTRKVGAFLEIDDDHHWWRSPAASKKCRENPKIFRFMDYQGHRDYVDKHVVHDSGTSEAITGANFFGDTGAVVGAVVGKRDREYVTSIDVIVFTSYPPQSQVRIEICDERIPANGFRDTVYTDLAGSVYNALLTISRWKQKRQQELLYVRGEMQKALDLYDAGKWTEAQVRAVEAELENKYHYKEDISHR